MEWLPLAVLGIMWVAFLLPTRGKTSTPQGSVGDFERRMELLAQAETHGTEGRWIVTPRKGVRFLGPDRADTGHAPGSAADRSSSSCSRRSASPS